MTFTMADQDLVPVVVESDASFHACAGEGAWKWRVWMEGCTFKWLCDVGNGYKDYL
jgi:hypothetical protein